MNPSDQATQHPLAGRKMYIPQMSFEASFLMAAAFKSIGVDATPSPDSDESTLQLAAKYTTGEECLPQRVVLGNLLKIVNSNDFIPEKNAFLLPTSSGPCRYGQYSPLIKKILREIGAEETLVFSPTSSDGYSGFAENVTHFMRTAWRATVIADILRKLLFMFRPYEKENGETDRIQKDALESAGQILQQEDLSLNKQMRMLVRQLKIIGNQFLRIPLKEPLKSRPCVGLMGEIFLRLNNYSNQNLIRHLEKLGGEAWLAGISEWVWYTQIEEQRKLREAGKKYSFAMLKTIIRNTIQHQDEKKLWRPFKDIIQDREEHQTRELLKYSWPYLPYTKSHGEMTLNAGNVVAFHKSGCDGVIDIGPFTCMNSIVSEVVYPKLSQDYNHIPIRVFYFDGVPVDLEGDLEIFMEMVKAYRKKRLLKE